MSRAPFRWSKRFTLLHVIGWRRQDTYLTSPTIQETNEMLRNARKQFQKSDESAYSIVPSRISSRLSTSTRQSLSSDDNMSYRRLSCENVLFTAMVYKRSYRTPLIRRLFRRKVQIESDTATITRPERTFSSKSPDTREHLIDSDKADHQIISGPNNRGEIPSYDDFRTVVEVLGPLPVASILWACFSIMKRRRVDRRSPTTLLKHHSVGLLKRCARTLRNQR